MRRGIAAVFGVGLGLLVSGAVHAACFDEAAWNGVLQRYTAPVPEVAAVGVDYAGLRRSRALAPLLSSLESCRPESLDADGRMALWINAYNVLVVEMVVRERPKKSIRDLGSLLRPVWKRPAGRVGGRAVTLHQIEHDILRPLGEPRIHGAMVCASQSCPPLRREPFSAARLDAQLDDQMRSFLADRRKGARLEGGRLRLSKIFDWFEEDFRAAGGVVAFVRPYLDFDPGAKPKLVWFDYDWSLNVWSGGNSAPQSRQ
jgi:hypothetical protein